MKPGKTKKGIVILGGGLLQVPLIVRAKKRDWTVIVADQNPKAPGALQADHFAPVSTRDFDLLIRSLKKFSGQFQYCATIGTDMTASVAAINEAYELGGLNRQQALVTTHKGKMRAFLKKAGLAQPDYIITADKEKAVKWARLKRSSSSFSGGFVIKPVHNMGARGVMYFKDPEELAFAFEYAQYNCHEMAQPKEIILEEYIKADELSVDALCIKGKVFITGLADRNIELKDGRYFVETGHTMPTQKGWGHDSVLEALQVISNALGKLSKEPYTGALKGDIRIQANGQVVVGEVASRLSGGFMSTHTYPYAGGHNLMDAYLDTLDHKIPRICQNGSHDQYKKVCIERAIIPQPGIVESLKINKPNHKGIKVNHIFTHFKKGDYIGSLQSNLGKAANVIITAGNLKTAERAFGALLKKNRVRTRFRPLSQVVLNKKSRSRFHKDFCHVCKVCDGKVCSSGVPGMGGTGKMKAFQDNLIALTEVKIRNYNPPKTKKATSKAAAKTGLRQNWSVDFLNKKLTVPILNAPITGSITNMGKSISEYDLAIETAMGLKELGLPALFGDGATPDKHIIGAEAIRQSQGGYLVVKPRKDNGVIREKILKAAEAGANGWGMDIDACNLKTMQLKKQAMAPKTTKDFWDISSKIKLPFFIKGIMDVKSAMMASDAGASAIVVSNHGGRIDDTLPGSARVLYSICKTMKRINSSLKIFVDGGIRSGSDVFKMLALGADGVLVGRPIAIAVVGFGRLGAYSIIENYSRELEDIMQKMHIRNLGEITEDFIRFPESWRKIF